MDSRGQNRINGVNSITCTNMPDELFDANNAKRHFSKFGKVTKITLRPKKQMCIIEYEAATSAKKALLNAGAYDGFMFDVSRTKVKERRPSKKDDDPEWLPDAGVKEELKAMGKTPIYRMSRQKPMELDAPLRPIEVKKVRSVKQLPKREIVNDRFTITKTVPSGTESPVIATAVSKTTAEAAMELHQLRSKVAVTPDEQWRLLEARDRILRCWGGAGGRVSDGGATIGTCPDMCPEKERLHRQAEHQVMSLEADEGCDYKLVQNRAVKQYSRSSADQEMPMCYELRPPRTLRMTCDYLLHEIADTHEVSLADWFHFMWDRLRSIRKDITQQALCCAESISLVEMCARFHAHCAARLADLEHTQFDQKLNTDNLTKCLQTLKHMYSDIKPNEKPREAEFRGYVALLNLGDSNFWWEIKQLPTRIQKSKDILFALEVFNAIDNNNYVRFFRLVKEKATYLQACILLRYFNDVRARALARMVKAFAPRGGSKYPAKDLMKCLAFETVDSMTSFINHYGLRLSKTDDDIDCSIILNRNNFIEDSDPYPLARSIDLIESKRTCSIGEVLAGGEMPHKEYDNHSIYTSFNANGTLKESALLAEDQGYNTTNDSNKNVNSLKLELQRLCPGGRNVNFDKVSVFKQETKPPPVTIKPKVVSRPNSPMTFSFRPAITIGPTTTVHDSNSIKEVFSFSNPYELAHSNINDRSAINLFSKPQIYNNDPRRNRSTFADESSKNIFNSVSSTDSSRNLFAKANVFNNVSETNRKSVFTSTKGNIFSKPTENKSANIFSNASADSNVFSKTATVHDQNIFNNQSKESSHKGSSIFGQNVMNGPHSTNLFNSAVNSIHNNNTYSIFKSKNLPQAEQEINLNNNRDYLIMKAEENEQMRKEELRNMERLQQEKRANEMKHLEELRRAEEKRKEEIKRQEELAKKAEEERLFKERVEKESNEVCNELLEEVNTSSVSELLKEEIESLQQLLDYAQLVNDEILEDECHNMCRSEMMAELHLNNRIMKKWFTIWKHKSCRNFKRRQLLEDTPVWLPEKPFEQEAICLKRTDEEMILTNMISVQNGYKFCAQFKPQPTPEPYKIVDIIRSSFLRRMRQIKYPYGKCFFWKITLVSPGAMKWIHRKLQIEPWIIAAFSDKKKHDKSHGLINVNRYTWNGLMDFAISVSLSNDENKNNCIEGLEGSHALLFYMSDDDMLYRIENTLRQKYPYQVLPVAVILPNDKDMYNRVEQILTASVNNKIISCYKLFTVDKSNTFDSVNNLTKCALKWLAKRCPANPPLEVDFLKSLCQRYLANELWHRLKLERHTGLPSIFNDLAHLVQFYNMVLTKLTNLLTNEDLYNYSLFPLEFKQYLDDTSPYPRPFEYISSSECNSENSLAIKELMSQLLLPVPSSYVPSDLNNTEEQIRDYCGMIGWIEDPDEILCKMLAILPRTDPDDEISLIHFNHHLENYNLLNLLNVVVYDKINRLDDFNNRCAIYDIASMKEYRDYNWWYEDNLVKSLKHKIVDSEPTDIDHYIEAKRRKLSQGPMEICSTSDNIDTTLLDNTISVVNENLNQFQYCNASIQQLDDKLEIECDKALELERILKAALHDT